MIAKAKANKAVSWVQELEYGSHKQGKGVLGDKDDGFCCLGLACETLNIPYRADASWPIKGILEESLGLLDAQGGWPVQGELVLDYLAEQEIDLGNSYISLGELNDEGMTFEQIAVMLKAIPEMYFESSVAILIKKYFAL